MRYRYREKDWEIKKWISRFFYIITFTTVHYNSSLFWWEVAGEYLFPPTGKKWYCSLMNEDKDSRRESTVSE